MRQSGFSRRPRRRPPLSIVRSSSADAYVRRPPAGVTLFLVHGPEEGMVHERAGLLARGLGASLGGGVLQMRGPEVLAKPGVLIDETSAISLFGDKRAIWVDADGADLTKALEPLLAEPPRECVVVIEAGNLKKGSALREAFERSAQAAAIECYLDDERSLGALIDDEARAAGLNVSRDAKDALLAALGADRMASRGELAKLTLYARGQGQIEAADVEAIVCDAAPSSLDALVDAALTKNMAGLENAAARFFGEGGDGEELLRRLLPRIALLRRLRLEMDKGRPFEAAAQALFVKLPPLARSQLGRQAEVWTSAMIARRLPMIHIASARIRRDPKLAAPLATRLLWALASGGARESRST